jgi:hypothetical protein
MTAALLLGAGCSDFGDTNVNPNASTVPTTSALLTNALTALGGSTAGGANFSAGLYAQYFSETQYTDNSLYSNQDVDWAGEMAGSIYDLQNIININSDPETAPLAALNGSNNDQIAIARILKAYRFSILTDRYGDMPYFEALKGNTQPVFDSQEDIYADIFKELDEAVEQFDMIGKVKGDILFDGDVTKWQKFANSLRLILALRVSDADDALGSAQFNDALNSEGGVIESNDENVEITYPGGAFKNPWFGIGADQGVSKTVADFLNVNGDQRRLAFGNAAAGVLIGVPYGLTREDAIAWTAANSGWSLILNNTYRGEASKLFVLTNADVLLARAEAAFKGWTSEDYVALYEEAIMASWEQWGVFSQSAYDSYIADADIALAGDDSAADAAKIATQRWLTFYPNGPQGWAEWRRTGFPVLVPTPNAVNTTGEIPVRFPFPSIEYSYNRTNIDAAVARMGSDNDATLVWWDVD